MKNEGICQDCIHKTSCMYKNENSSPVYYCEEYESCPHQKVRGDEVQTKVEKEKVDAYFSGLCVNCDNRKDCCIRNSEHVIWHCEEYV